MGIILELDTVLKGSKSKNGDASIAPQEQNVNNHKIQIGFAFPDYFR